MLHVLFVCTGNTCRSPMAESMLRDKAGKFGVELQVRSAGVSAWDGQPISDHATACLKARGVQPPAGSKSVTAELVDWADLILTMTASHKRGLFTLFPQAVERTFTLKEYVMDEPEIQEKIRTRESLYSELELKKATGAGILPEELDALRRLEADIPSFDIMDPFGGSQEEYEACASEIEEQIDRLMQKIRFTP